MSSLNDLPRVLFITRKYPPQVGGMENYSFGLISSYPGPKSVIALRLPQIHLLWFIPYALLVGISRARKYDVLYLTDGLLAPLGVLLRVFTRRPVLMTAHGLDITYKNRLYRRVVLPAITRLDHLIMVSRQTIGESVQRGVDIEKCSFIPNGYIELSGVRPAPTLTKHSTVQGIDLTGKYILLTVGRLIRRKGVYWFIEHVLPLLPENVLYFIVGKGEEHHRITTLIHRLHLERRVLLFGYVPEAMLQELYGVTKVFIMPNIRVAGDVEGFGIVALEAAANGLPVVASRLEGIQEAITDGVNGMLVENGNAQAFADAIQHLINDPDAYARLSESSIQYTRERYNWKVIIQQYIHLFRQQTQREHRVR